MYLALKKSIDQLKHFEVISSLQFFWVFGLYGARHGSNLFLALAFNSKTSRHCISEPLQSWLIKRATSKSSKPSPQASISLFLDSIADFLISVFRHTLNRIIWPPPWIKKRIKDDVSPQAFPWGPQDLFIAQDCMTARTNWSSQRWYTKSISWLICGFSAAHMFWKWLKHESGLILLSGHAGDRNLNFLKVFGTKPNGFGLWTGKHKEFSVSARLYFGPERFEVPKKKRSEKMF